MRKAVRIFFMMIATYVATEILLCNEAMADNRGYIQIARERIKKFEEQKEPEYLREACFDLTRIDLDNEKDSSTRAAIRTRSLLQWLDLLQVLDNYLDPGFDPNNEVALHVQPPKTKDGIVYPPGSDPKLIKDLKARAEYEKAIEENWKKQRSYRLQIHLHRIENLMLEEAQAFIRDNYTKVPVDQNELRSSIKKILKNPVRQSAFLKFIDSK